MPSKVRQIAHGVTGAGTGTLAVGLTESVWRRRVTEKMVGNNIEVPFYFTYYPSLEDMNNDQKQYYSKWKDAFSKDKYLDVNGNISYIFVYMYEVVSLDNIDLIISELTKNKKYV